MSAVSNGYHNHWGDQPRNSSTPREGMSPKRDSGSPQMSASNGYSSEHSDSDDGPTYLLEHLATFSVGQAHNIVEPEDGLQKLWQMEKKTGIWTQKMQMRLHKQWIVIIDFENGDVVEKFPMNLISSPMAHTGVDPKEMYNNILIFIVKEDPKRKNLNPSEMHIFRCVQVSAQKIVDDMKLFMAGKWKFPKNERLPPPPNAPAPEPPMNGVNMRQSNQRFSAASNPDSRPPSGHNLRDSIDETSSTSSEKYEKEVGILNHCFDDIEQFIAWLQSAAAAYRELERRRHSRKSKNKDHGDGMLSMRAKAPPERDFVDVLQKFKLSFNLLAKLKAHIHDPNAPELVHFLFTPLALIVDASRESLYGVNMAPKVVSPLLTKEAIDLLTNCLTSKESDLWHSLGEAWLIPRDLWKGPVSPYKPHFRDGYSPEYPFGEDRRSELASAAAITAAQKNRRDEILRAQREAEAQDKDFRGFYFDTNPVDRIPTPDDHRRSPYSDQEFPRDLHSNISADSIERGGDPQRQFERHQRQWLEELKLRNSRIVQVIFPRTANNDKELTVFRGEYLEILDSSRNWWKARNIRGQVAHVPHTIVISTDEDGSVVNNPAYDPAKNMSLQNSPNLSLDGSVSGGERQPPPRAPPIPPPGPASVEWVPQHHIAAKKEPVTTNGVEPAKKPSYKSYRDRLNEDAFREELSKTVSRKKPLVKRRPLPTMYIDDESDANEVQIFLNAKAFSPEIQKTLSGMTGIKMFHLSKKECIIKCGQREEGLRLNSQMEVCKVMCGFTTGTVKELFHILRMQREKIGETVDGTLKQQKPKRIPETTQEIKKAVTSPTQPNAPTGFGDPQETRSSSRSSNSSNNSDSLGRSDFRNNRIPKPSFSPTPAVKSSNRSSYSSNSTDSLGKNESRNNRMQKPSISSMPSSPPPPPLPPPNKV